MPVPTPELDQFGALIRDGRMARKLSQAALGLRLGIVQSEVSAIERGERREVTAHLVSALADALGLDDHVLLRAAADRVNHHEALPI